MRARLLRGVGANLYAQLVTAVVQLAAVPVLLRLWGPARYGTWTLLGALPAALAFADGGLVLATGTAMTMAAARGDTALAARLHRRAARVVGAVVLGVAALAAAVLLGGSPVAEPLLTPFLRHDGSAPLLLVFTLITLAGLLGTLPGAVFRADDRYALGMALGATMRAVETVAVVAAAPEGLAAAAIAWLVARLFGVGLQWAVALIRVPWLREAHMARAAAPLAPLLRPALAAVALPAGFAANLQGVTLAAGYVLPPEAVAAFAAARTLCRLIVQLSGLFNHALMPELSRMAARRDRAGEVAVLRANRTATAALLIPAWILLLVAGPTLLATWTGGRLPLTPAVLPLVATAALLHGLWLARANLLLAVNRQAEFAWMFLAVAAATAVSAAAAGRAFALPGVAAATLVGEAAMAGWIAFITRDRTAGVVTVVEAVLP